MISRIATPIIFSFALGAAAPYLPFALATTLTAMKALAIARGFFVSLLLAVAVGRQVQLRIENWKSFWYKMVPVET